MDTTALTISIVVITEIIIFIIIIIIIIIIIGITMMACGDASIPR